MRKSAEIYAGSCFADTEYRRPCCARAHTAANRLSISLSLSLYAHSLLLRLCCKSRDVRCDYVVCCAGCVDDDDNDARCSYDAVVDIIARTMKRTSGTLHSRTLGNAMRPWVCLYRAMVRSMLFRWRYNIHAHVEKNTSKRKNVG